MASWALTKQTVRLWIERKKADSKAGYLTKKIAQTILFAHLLKSFVRNLPRTVRIYILSAARPGFNGIFVRAIFFLPACAVRALETLRPSDAFDSSRLPASAANPEARIEAFASYDKEVRISASAREVVANSIAELNSQICPRQYQGKAPAKELKELRENGIVPLPEFQFTPEQVEEIVSFLKTKPVYGAHLPVYSDGVPRSLDSSAAREFPFGSYSMKDACDTPHLLELAFQPKIQALVEEYMGCAPSFYSAHSWWSFPGHDIAGPQTFHRDLDDFRFLALFVFLTDVEGGAKGGEHDYILGTHSFEEFSQQVGDPLLTSEFFNPKGAGTAYDEEFILRKLLANQFRSITGRAGSVFLADVFGLHRGVRPTENGRLVCWLRFGLRRNHSYVNDRTEPVGFDWSTNRLPDTPYNRFVGRLLLG